MRLARFGRGLKAFLNSPSQVLLICGVFLMVSVLLDGVLWRLWSLRRDTERLEMVIASTRTSILSLDRQLRQAKDPAFIERQARDRLDLVGENDLIFVFPEE